jgi:hypothetical protein
MGKNNTRVIGMDIIIGCSIPGTDAGMVGNSYQVTGNGNQTWITENLGTTHSLNGELILNLSPKRNVQPHLLERTSYLNIVRV